METRAFENAALLSLHSVWRLYVALGFACCLVLFAIQPAWAAEFSVTSTLDGADSNLGDGICLNELVTAGGACTLRAAIQEANAIAGPDTITLPAGTYILTLENALDNPEDASATGDLDVLTNIIIQGAGADVTIIEAKADLHDRVIHLVGDQAVLGINSVTVRNGNTTELAAGTRDGGGILVGGGKLEAFELVVANSTSPSFGGGIMFIGVNSSKLDRCTIHGNAAAGGNARGGGIFHGQNYFLDVINCTISDNEAESRGGGIDVSNNSNLITILNTTIADNRLVGDPEQGAGIYIGNSTEIDIRSSVIANNFAQGNVANDCYGQIDLLDFSLVEVPALANACIIAGGGESISSLFGSEDPLLGPLADNGGSLPTHALLEGSIAIDAGSQLTPGSAVGACEAVDARGETRPSGPFCDMGAFEFQIPQISAIALQKTATPLTYASIGTVITYTYLITNTGDVSLAGPVTVTDNKATVTCPAGGLVPLQSMICIATYVITQADLDSGSVTNTATASANGTISNQAQATVTATITATQSLYMPKLSK